MFRSLPWMVIHRSARAAKMYRRVLRSKRSLAQLETRLLPIPTPQGFFSHDLTHYQSHFMPAFQQGSLHGLDSFVGRQQGRPPNFLLGRYSYTLVEPVTQPMTHLYSTRYWETAQSINYQKWHTETVLRSQGLPANPSPASSTATTVEPTPDDPLGQKQRTKEQQLAYIALALADTLPKFFVKIHNYYLYDPNVVFDNRLRGVFTTGLRDYSFQLTKYKTLGHILYSFINFEVLKITEHPEDRTVRVRWRIQRVGGLAPIVQFWKFLSAAGRQELLRPVDGFSTFYVGETGLITKHVADNMMPDDEKPVLEKVNLKLAKLAGVMGFILPGAAAGGISAGGFNV